MEWSGSGILISSRPHGEHAAILELFTEAQGRHAGVMRGGQSRRHQSMLQPGNQLSIAWRARLSDHLGSYTVELERDRASGLMAARSTLTGLGAVAGLLAYALPERLAVPDLYHRTEALLEVMPMTEAWTLGYLQWELALLDALGFGLSLDQCAVTGQREDLVYLSPKSGRAVSRAGAGDWADRLLPLPPCMRGEGEALDSEIATALETTGHFLRKHVVPQWSGQPFPSSRDRLIDLLRRPARSTAI